MDIRYAKNPDVVYRAIAGEHVLVPIRQKAVDLKSIFTLNDAAAFIWESVDGGRTVREIRDRVAEMFDVDADQAQADTAAILEQFAALGLVTK